MTRRLFLLPALALVLACTEGMTQPEPAIEVMVAYGVEPSPFFPSATNELYAVVQHLTVVEDQVGALCQTSGRCLPYPAILGKLEAMANELSALEPKVAGALAVSLDSEIPGFGDLRDAAVAVNNGALAVWLAAYHAKAGFEPSPFEPTPIGEAFDLVLGGAEAIHEAVIGSPFCFSAAGGISCGPVVLPNPVGS